MTQKKGRNVINANVPEHVKDFFNVNYKGMQSVILGNLAEEYMREVQRKPEMLHNVLAKKFRIIDEA